MKRTTSAAVIFASALIGLVSARPASAAILYSQGAGDPYLQASQSPYSATYDNFSLNTASRVQNVAWVGGFFNPGTHAAIASFNVSFYGDTGGAPGALLQSETVVGNANEAAYGDGFRYNYNTSLHTAFAVAAGSKYWMSIVDNTTYFPQWGWALGTGGDGKMVQDFNGSRSMVTGDAAFTLSGTASTPSGPSAVPEPASASLLLGAAPALLALRRRKR